mmetsp:Transcript_22337/g.55143  ORF Transcript_22337/g.55143 Transcript_22337/m.55143 type:complete len:273 (-) Transcript_22337:1510-2328(-)
MTSTCSSALAPTYRRPLVCASSVPALRPPRLPKVGSIHSPTRRCTRPCESTRRSWRVSVARSAFSVSRCVTLRLRLRTSCTTKLACLASVERYETSRRKVRSGNLTLAGYEALPAAEGPVGALKLMRMKACPASCVTAMDLIAAMWKGTNAPWMGSSTDSASRSTLSTKSATRGTGTSATDLYDTKSAVAPPLPPSMAACCAPIRRWCVSRFFLSASAACFRLRASSSLGPPISVRVLASITTPPSATVAALAFFFLLLAASSSSPSSSSLI